MNEEKGLPEEALEEQEEAFGAEMTDALGSDSDHIEAENDLTDPLEEEAKAAWEEQDDNVAQAGVAVGLSPLGPVVQVVSPDGTLAQKVVSVEELFLLAGQMTAIGGLMMQMGMQAQMQEQARIEAMMKSGEEKTASGLYVKKR